MGTAGGRSTFGNTSQVRQAMQTQPQESSTSTLESSGKISGINGKKTRFVIL